MLNALDHLNQQLFLLLYAGAEPNTILLSLAQQAAEIPLVLSLLISGGFMFKSLIKNWRTTLIFLVCPVCSMGAAYAIRTLWYLPRPFITGLGETLITHAPTASLPSAHATLIFSLAASMLLIEKRSAVSILLFSFGFITAWARIYVGVHYPLDMLVALIISLLFASITKQALNSRIVKSFLFQQKIQQQP